MATTPIQMASEHPARQSGAPGCVDIVVPVSYAAKDGLVKDQGVQTRHCDQHDLHAEERAVVTLDGLGCEQDGAAQDHRREANPDPGQKLSRNRRNRAAAHDQPKQTEVQNRGWPEHYSQGQRVDRLDHGELPGGLFHAAGPRQVLKPFTER